ncbi:MAG: tRNA pseudouridine(38-40) synthase TruA [Lachnospiraceae bacterium]|nr:tRNA pseudouridine(38-40) synthase TruA [Lachnospiraceae bacterium]
MERNYKLKISYDGTRYYGWEHQPDRETIQGKLETVLTRMCDGQMVDVIGAGRTDAGVHARAMVANARMDTGLSCEEILTYMNRYLPDDIAVLEVREASERFHARYKAVGKTYRYTCFDGPVKPVFDRKYYTSIDTALDVEKMQQAAVYLEGEHDYKSFCGNSRMKKSTVRIVDTITIHRRKGYVYLTFHGTGFLQNMVRIMVGTLLEVGLGRMEPEQVRDILEAKDRKVAGPTAPAKGLCLMKVDY